MELLIFEPVLDFARVLSEVFSDINYNQLFARFSPLLTCCETLFIISVSHQVMAHAPL
jgi:hypothetical protein